MRSYHITYGGGLPSLRLQQHDRPTPGPGEVLVEVKAAAIGYRDRLILAGSYVLPVKDDVVPLAEGSGVVAALGPGVTDLAVGTRVVAQVFPRWPAGVFRPQVADQLGGSLDGLLTEYRVLPRAALLEMPPHLTFTAAAALPCTGLTAWNAITGGRSVRPGETVLTLGAGGVSRFAIAFARLAGARVVATTGDDANTEQLRALGADVVLNYRSTDWPAEVRAATGGVGAHLIVEVAGALSDSLRAAARGSELALVGLIGAPLAVDVRTLFTSGATVRPVAVGSLDQFAQMLQAVQLHQVSVPVEHVFPFDAAPDAFAHYLSGRPGKVVIAVNGADG
jgi:NADPH:quinone reductase-like Zn-dependent oxidoreductase